LGIDDWNDEDIIVEITGKTVLGGNLLRCPCLLIDKINMTYGGAGLDDAFALVQTNDGGYALAGRTNSFGSQNKDLWMVKTDAFGNCEWNKTYGGTGSDGAFDLVQTNDGGYALAGWTDSFGSGDYDFWLFKTGGKAEPCLLWVSSSPDTITLYRAVEDPLWNYMRVRILKAKE
jgi:hypothetical protein